MAKTAAQMTAKFARGLADAGPAYVEGIMSTTRNPAEAAIAAEPKYERAMMESIAEKRYSAGLQGVTLQEWQQLSKAGQNKFTQSAQTAAQKYNRYATAAAPLLAQISQKIQNMPNVTEGDAEQRMVENMREMRSLRGLGKRGRR